LISTSRRAFLTATLAAACGRSLPALADPPPLRFGITPVIPDDRARFLNAWSVWLAGQLGRPVVFVERPRYREILDLLLRGQIDLAWICGYPYVQHRASLTLLAVPRFRDQTLYQSYLIVAADGTARSLADLEGGLFAWADPDSNSGWLYPNYALVQLQERPKVFFARTFFTWAHRKVLEAVAAGLAQGGAVDGYVWETVQRLQPNLTEKTRIVEKSPEFGFPPLVARREAAEPQKSAAAHPEQIESLLHLDLLELEVGYGLIPLVDEEQQGNLLERIRSIRRQFALEMGFIVSPLRVRDNLQLKPGEYRFLIKNNEVARGEMMLGYCLALNPGEVKNVIEGIPTQEPAFQLPALWISEKRKDEAQFAGYTVVDISTIIATHLTEVIRSHAQELLSRQDVQKLLDHLAQSYPKSVDELTPNLLSLGVIQRVLQNLLKERVSIRDLLTIVETLADYGPITKDPDILTEYVRQKLARSILKQYETLEGVLPLVTLDQHLEDILREGIQKMDQTAYLSLEPSLAQRILISINQTLEKIVHLNYQPIILCSPPIRRHLKKLLDRFMPQVVVISHNELTAQSKIQSLGTVTINQ